MAKLIEAREPGQALFERHHQPLLPDSSHCRPPDRCGFRFNPALFAATRLENQEIATSGHGRNRGRNRRHPESPRDGESLHASLVTRIIVSRFRTGLYEWQSHNPAQAPGAAVLTVSGCGRPVTVQPKSGVWTPLMTGSGRVLSNNCTSCPAKRMMLIGWLNRSLPIGAEAWCRGDVLRWTLRKTSARRGCPE